MAAFHPETETSTKKSRKYISIYIFNQTLSRSGHSVKFLVLSVLGILRGNSE